MDKPVEPHCPGLAGPSPIEEYLDLQVRIADYSISALVVAVSACQWVAVTR